MSTCKRVSVYQKVYEKDNAMPINFYYTNIKSHLKAINMKNLQKIHPF